jgi:hypothetical protein
MFRCAGQSGSGPSCQTLGRRGPNAWLTEQEFCASLNPVRLTRALRADELRRAVSPNKFLVRVPFSPQVHFCATRTGQERFPYLRANNWATMKAQRLSWKRGNVSLGMNGSMSVFHTTGSILVAELIKAARWASPSGSEQLSSSWQGRRASLGSQTALRPNPSLERTSTGWARYARCSFSASRAQPVPAAQLKR